MLETPDILFYLIYAAVIIAILHASFKGPQNS